MVESFRYSEDIPVLYSVFLSVSANNVVIPKDAYPFGMSYEEGSVFAFADSADLIGIKTILLRKRRHFSMVVAEQAKILPGGNPDPVFAVTDNGADPYPFQKFN